MMDKIVIVYGLSIFYQACACARALAKFTPLHHWEGGELQLGQNAFEAMHFTQFLHDVGAKQLIGRLRAMP